MKNIFIGLIGLIGLIGPTGLIAAEAPVVYLTGPETAVAPGSEFKVTVLLDSDEPINALEIELFYPSGLEFLGFDNSASIVGLWHQGPRVFTDGRIELVGGILDPFQGVAGEVVSLDFRVREEGNYIIDVLKSNLYLADGAGTKVLAAAAGAEFSVSADAPSYSLVVAPDTTPPEVEVEIAREPAGGAVLLVFVARDRESGVSFASFRARAGLRWGEWQLASNPLVLHGNVWQAQIRVFNSGGQAAVKTLYLWDNFFKNFWPFILGVILILILSAVLIYYNKYKRHKS